VETNEAHLLGFFKSFSDFKLWLFVWFVFCFFFSHLKKELFSYMIDRINTELTEAMKKVFSISFFVVSLFSRVMFFARFQS
jgi:flagellar biosynthesis protein FlhB